MSKMESQQAWLHICHLAHICHHHQNILAHRDLKQFLFGHWIPRSKTAVDPAEVLFKWHWQKQKPNKFQSQWTEIWLGVPRQSQSFFHFSDLSQLMDPELFESEDDNEERPWGVERHLERKIDQLWYNGRHRGWRMWDFGVLFYTYYSHRKYFPCCFVYCHTNVLAFTF